MLQWHQKEEGDFQGYEKEPKLTQEQQGRKPTRARNLSGDQINSTHMLRRQQVEEYWKNYGRLVEKQLGMKRGRIGGFG